MAGQQYQWQESLNRYDKDLRMIMIESLGLKRGGPLNKVLIEIEKT